MTDVYEIPESDLDYKVHPSEYVAEWDINELVKPSSYLVKPEFPVETAHGEELESILTDWTQRREELIASARKTYNPETLLDIKQGIKLLTRLIRQSSF